MRSPCDQRVSGLRMENLLSPSARGAETGLYIRPIPNQTCISLDNYVWSTSWECHLSQRHNSRVRLPPAQTWTSCCPLLISQHPHAALGGRQGVCVNREPGTLAAALPHATVTGWASQPLSGYPRSGSGSPGTKAHRTGSPTGLTLEGWGWGVQPLRTQAPP